MYKSAVAKFKSGEFAVAMYDILFLINEYPNTKKIELSSCHSTLASVYRELGSYDLAINHCQIARELRKSCLNKDDILIKNIEKKLEDLLALSEKYQKKI